MDPDKTPDVLATNKLFDVRQELEELTKKYVLGLLESSSAAKDHAKLLSTIFESVPEGLIVFDKEAKIILANRAAAKLAGTEINCLTREELMKRYVFYTDASRTREIPEEDQPYMVALKEGRSSAIEGLAIGALLPPEGVWLRAHAAPIYADDGEVIGVVSILQNISESKRNRALISSLNNQRDVLLNIMTHDIKNHLVGESHLLSGLFHLAERQLDKETVSLLSKLQESNQQILQMTATLLEVYRAQVSIRENHATEVDMALCLQSALEMNESMAQARAVTIHLDAAQGLPAVRGLPSALQHVFYNLIQNAVKASLDGQKVELRVRHAGAHIVVDIIDQGEGVSDDLKALLFDPSLLANRNTADFLSSGMGLFLCQLLVVAHGGEIFCESELGKGATFSVRIPIDPALQTSTAEGSVSETAAL